MDPLSMTSTTPSLSDLDSPPSAGSSQRSSPTSPAAAFAHFPAFEEAGPSNRSSPSARGTPQRAAVNLPRTHSSGKGGCWTCRLRRKKCDELREGDSCQTCSRLQIRCLGWGAKRPEWLRDKQAQEAYKSEIKAQLTREGKIRGQPKQRRTPPSGLSPYPMSSDHLLPGVPGPGPGHRGAPLIDAHTDFSLDMFGFPQSYVDPTNMGHSPFGSPHDSPFIPGTFTNNINALHFQTDPSLSASSSSGVPLPTHDEPTYHRYTVPAETAIPANFDPLAPAYPPTAVEQDSNGRGHVRYYFEHVRPTQFPFAGESLDDALDMLIMREPQGPIAHAVCALASLHFARTNGLDAVAQHNAAKPFYEHAYFQLASAMQLNGQYSESDAVAAIHLVAYSLLSGGAAEWPPMLEIACEWLAQTQLLTEENPKLVMMNMSPTGRFAAKATMWFDIFSSVTLAQPPKFLSLYRRLLGGGAGYWARSSASEGQYDITMESLTGCPDDIMLALAETAALAYWKAQELRRASLSVRELVRRGDVIEQSLRRASALLPVDPRMPVRRASLDARAVGHDAPAPAAPSGVRASPETNTEFRRVVADVFRETALLYLSSILSGSVPGVPEIGGSVKGLARCVQLLPPGAVDRALVLPLCLAGCLTDDPGQRKLFHTRLRAQQLANGNAAHAAAVMEELWQQRDSRGAAVDWRRIMVDRRMNLLLV